ncbi:MAG: heat-inducible transcriptional repressor HrcA [Clostridia bacterium]|nr:heat-inducible transcriptional repressor HrcA [Clostridia bacterium]
MDQLSARKKRLLEAVVDSYICSVEPISSSAIQKEYMPDVSSATIRSELAGLEELGYLVKPHVSAGRVPSSKAYRYYVESILSSVSEEDIDELEQAGRAKIEGVETIVKDTVKVVSDITNYTSLMVLEGVDNLIVKEVKLINLGNDTALVIVITDAGVLRDKLIDIGAGVTDGYLDSAACIINDAFGGRSIKDISYSDTLPAGVEEFKQVFDEVVALLRACKSGSDSQIYVEGTDKIFDYPEYKDVDNVRNFMSVISRKDKIHELIDGDSDIEFSIKIGAEEGVKNMALVTARYAISGNKVGRVGVIGPERMDYKKVIKVLSRLGRTIGELTDKEDKDV